MDAWGRLRREVMPVAGKFGAPLLARVGATVLQAVTMILLARDLGPAEFGPFASSLGIGAVLGSLLGFGSSAQALRLLATPRPEGLAATLLLLRLGTAAVVAAAVLAVGWGGPRETIILAAVYATTEVICELAQSIMLGMKRTVLAHLAIVLRRALPVALLLAGAVLHADAALGLSAGWILSTVITMAFCFSLLGRPIAVATAVRSGVHFWSSTALVKLQNLDVVLLQAVGAPALVGQYAAAARVVNPLNLFTATLLSILTPKLASAADAEERALVFRQGRLALLGYFAALVAAAPLAYWLGPALLGEEYRPAAPLFAAFTIAAGISGLGQIHVSLLYALDLAHRVALVRLGAIPAGLAVLLLATYAAGITGAALAVIATQIMPVLLLRRIVVKLDLEKVRIGA